jgi:hypothetical protein
MCRDSKHTFILGTPVLMVANNVISLSFQEVVIRSTHSEIGLESLALWDLFHEMHYYMTHLGHCLKSNFPRLTVASNKF